MIPGVCFGMGLVIRSKEKWCVTRKELSPGPQIALNFINFNRRKWTRTAAASSAGKRWQLHSRHLAWMAMTPTKLRRWVLILCFCTGCVRENDHIYKSRDMEGWPNYMMFRVWWVESDGEHGEVKKWIKERKENPILQLLAKTEQSRRSMYDGTNWLR